MSDLYNRIAELCQNYGITITAMCRESGASRASLSDLKVGRKQNLSTETLDKIADYFGTTVDYLLGRTDDAENNDRLGLDISDDEIRELEETKKAPTPEGERPKSKLRSIARLEDSKITPEQDEQIADYIDFLLSKKKEL